MSYAETIQEELWDGQASLLEKMRQPNWRLAVRSTHDPNNTNWRNLVRFQTCSKQAVVNGYTRYMTSLMQQGSLTYTSPRPPLKLPDDPVNELLLPVFEEFLFLLRPRQSGHCAARSLWPCTPFSGSTIPIPQHFSNWCRPILKQVPRDPFGGGEALRYRRTGFCALARGTAFVCFGLARFVATTSV